MEKLFDEVFMGEDFQCRTIWYGNVDVTFDSTLSNKIVDVVKSDMKEKEVGQTNWVFYAEKVTKDAIDDNVRQAIMIKEKNKIFYVNCNLSDYTFVVNFDTVKIFKELLEEKLRS